VEPDEVEQSQEKRQGPEIGALSLEREEREIGERRGERLGERGEAKSCVMLFTSYYVAQADLCG
tara:strand:- start:657 stop:848 length:192 start_codon:yes stop_codon:yes gene_type:complete